MMIKLTLDFSPNLGLRDVWVDEEVWAMYQKDYIAAYAKQTKWYSIGKMSGRVLHEGRMYGEIAKFAQHLPSAAILEENINVRNPELISPKMVPIYTKLPDVRPSAVGYGTWLSIDEEVFEACKDQIETVIRKEVGETKKDVDYQFHAYGSKAQKVVYLSFYQACYWSGEIYAVPLDVAYELHLGDYEGKRMGRFDELWHQLAPYEVKMDVTYDEDGSIKESPYRMIEVFNFD